MIAFRMKAMMTVATIARTSVKPMALSCSIQSDLPTTSFRFVLRLPLTEAVAKMPVMKAPSVPPTAWTPKVSSASSYLKSALSLVQARNGTAPARMPTQTAPVLSMKPQAGVTTTRPATAPEQKPRTEACLRVMSSRPAQTVEAIAVAIVVVVKALAATTSEATAEPALKPYQPTQSMPVPTIHSTMLCGGIGVLPKPRRGPRIKQRISADQPEDMCTTVPPAKSMALMAAPAFQTPFM